MSKKLFSVGLLIALTILVTVVLLQLKSNQKVLTVGHQIIVLDVAHTKLEREKGLSGRSNLPEDRGMLFDFEKPAKPCFWMKDMHFPLDILWINDHKEIVYIRRNVSPSTYPTSFCTTEPAQYAIELNAGAAKKFDLNLGEPLNF